MVVHFDKISLPVELKRNQPTTTRSLKCVTLRKSHRSGEDSRPLACVAQRPTFLSIMAAHDPLASETAAKTAKIRRQVAVIYGRAAGVLSERGSFQMPKQVMNKLKWLENKRDRMSRSSWTHRVALL